MTEFEWRRQLRDLRSDTEPPAHVWTGILSRIGAAATIAQKPIARAHDRGKPWRDFGWPALAAAAVVVMTFAIALVAPSPHSVSPETARVAPAELHFDRNAGDGSAAMLSAALSAELARNPVLAATDAELRELEEQLQRALALEPESSKLRRMLVRAGDERRRLLQYQSQLG